MKGTEAIFFTVLLGIQSIVLDITLHTAPTPPQRPAELPKSKYFVSQMASFLRILRNGTELR